MLPPGSLTRVQYQNAHMVHIVNKILFEMVYINLEEVSFYLD